MKTLVSIIAITFCTVSYAGDGHSHGHGHTHAAPEMDVKKAQETGQFHVNRLVKSQKIDASWSNATLDKAERKKFDKKTEWVVTFNNDKGVKGKKLYIFLELNGKFVAANFTGK